MSYTILKKESLPHSEVELEIELPWQDVEKHRTHSIKHLNEEVELPGFRKGKIPEDILKKRLGDFALTEEMAEHAIGEVIPEIVVKEGIDMIGRPNIQITQIAEKNPLKFKLKSAVVPKVELPDYLKIAKELNKDKKAPDAVTEKDIDETIEKVRKNLALQKGAAENKSKEEAVKEENLPKVDDAFAKSLGAESLEKLRNTVKQNLEAERKQTTIEKHRIQLSEKIVSDTKVELPEILIESELNRIEAQFKDDIVRFGVKFEDYLSHAKKTIEDLRKDWRPDAEKRAKLQLALNKIAEAEKVNPDQKAIDAEVHHLMSHYKDADETRVRTYVETVLTNEGVYQLLESQQ